MVDLPDFTRQKEEMTQRTPTSFSSERERDYEEDANSIRHSTSRNSITDQAKETVFNSATYITRYSTAMLHHVVSESVWLNMKNLPIRVLRFIAFVEIIAWFSICIYFGQETYYQMAEESFISIDTSAGICKDIPKYLDLSQLISINDGAKGYWSSQPGYETNSSAYRITLENFRSSPVQFQELYLNQIAERLNNVGERGLNRGLPWNLILWSTFSYRIAEKGSGSILFNLEGDVNTIFNKEIIYAGVASMYGLCEPTKTRGRWNHATMSYQLVIQDYFEHDHLGKCPDMGMMNIDPNGPNITVRVGPNGVPENLNWTRNHSNSINAAHFGYNKLTAIGKDLKIDFDMRSISMALAINMEQLNISELSRIAMDDDDASFPFNYCNQNIASCAGLNVTDWASFYAPRYIGMKGLLCIGIIDAYSSVGEEKHFCFIRQGSMMLYPTIDHKENCNCALVNSNETIKRRCNKQDFVVGLLYYSWETYQYFPLTLEAVAFLKYGLYGSTIGDDFLNMYVRPAALTTLRGAIPDENVTQSEVRDAFMSICQYYPCSLIVFNGVDLFSNTINGYAFEVKSGACNNTVYNAERFSKMLDTPFEFTEKYKSCEHTPFNVAVFTIAVSSGNAQIMTQIIMFFMTMLIGIALSWVGYKTNYTTEIFEEWSKERKYTKDAIIQNRKELSQSDMNSTGSLLVRTISQAIIGDGDEEDTHNFDEDDYCLQETGDETHADTNRFQSLKEDLKGTVISVRSPRNSSDKSWLFFG